MHNKHELTTCKNDPRFETMQSRSSHVKGWIGTHTLKLPTTGPPHVSFLKLGAPQTTDGLSALKLQFGDMPAPLSKNTKQVWFQGLQATTAARQDTHDI